MRQIVNEITDRLLSELPAGQGYFTLTELARYDFPVFFLERVSMELRKNLISSLELPDNEWIAANSDKIRQAWNKFKESISSEVSLPSNRAGSVFRTCVEEIVNTLVEPRRYVPELLFRSGEELTESEIEDNADWLVVYEHFANALMRYMVKKDQDRIGKEKGKAIIAQIDEKLTQNYTSLNWVQLLEPWFALMGDEIDSALLSLFFKEKGKGYWVRRFKKENRRIKRSEIIEILSEPEVDSEGSEEDEKELTASEQPEKAPETEVIVEPVSRDDTDKKHSSHVWKPEPSIMKNSKEEVEQSGDKKEGSEAIPIWKRFASSDNGEDSLAGRFSKKDNGKKESTLADSLAPEKPDEQNKISIGLENPIEEDLEDAGEDLKKLFRYVNDQSDYFVHQLFGGDDNTFIQALEDIASFETWDKASKYITNDIFRRNMVDIYSEPALDFTDTLQNYFLEKSKSEKR